MRLTLFLRENIGWYRVGRLDREYENVVPVLATFVGEYENRVAVLTTFVGEYENRILVLPNFAGEYENRTPVVLISAPALAHHISMHSFLSVHRYGISQL